MLGSTYKRKKGAQRMDSGSSFLLTAKIIIPYLGSYKNVAPEKEKKDSSLDIRFWAAIKDYMPRIFVQELSLISLSWFFWARVLHKVLAWP